MVEDSVTRFKYTPFEEAGLAFCRSAISACRFSFSALTSKFALPIVQCTMPALSTRYVTWPALAFFTAVATSGVTVPTFGFGMSPRGPRIWPSCPTTRMASGLAMTRSKSISPAFTLAARSSSPTISAPAALAASWFLPEVNTATRTVLPVPCGMTVEPRTCWSDLLASMPRFTAASTLSANLAVANSFTSLRASSTGYCLPGVSLAFQALIRFAVAISHPLHIDAHAAGTARDGANRGIQIRGLEVGLLELGDFLELLARDLANLRGIGGAAALFNTDGLADQHRRRWGLHHEGEAAIRVHGDDHRDRQPLLHFLGLGVELLAELHDVHALLTERRPDGRRGVGGACRHLQLDITLYFLGH